MWYPTGSCKPPLEGGGIALLSSISPSCCSLVEELLPFLFDLVAISILASVVSDGSPGSPFAAAFSPAVLARVRGRFTGVLVDESTEAEDFLCLMILLTCAAESPASSPDASRDDG